MADPEGNASTSNGPSPPKLIQYRTLTGILTPSTFDLGKEGRPGPNIGIYARIIREEKLAARNYRLFSTIINLSFLGQIVVAATLTALGAADGGRIGITVLGSINTVIAGVQTYLKGQGLPNRIKQYQFGLRKLREYMEDRERDFSSPDCKLEVDKVVADVAEMYKAVRQTAEDNTPDNYLPMEEGAGKKLLGQKDTQLNLPGLLDQGIDSQVTAEGKGTGKDDSGENAGELGPNHDGEAEDAPLLKGT